MSTSVSLNADKERYEIVVDGELVGFTEAHPRGDVVSFPHTVVDDKFRGRGLATQLVQAALDDVRARGLTIRATCSVVLAFLEKHPEYQDLIAA